MVSDLKTVIERDGFAVVHALAPSEAVTGLRAAVAGIGHDTGVRRRRESTYAIRNLPQLVPEVREFALSGPVLELVRSVLGPDPFPVKGILFDKTPEANWHVGWHQDVTIAVAERRMAPGFERWSEKSGLPHVQPPDAVLAGMLTLRLHLDPCDVESGALRVIPGSHAEGRLDDSGIRRFRETTPPVTCAAQPGDALLMRPLLLHASSPAANPGHRRVIHLEYAAGPLPHGLRWPSFAS